MTKLSIIVPFYNCEKTLHRTINSILMQDVNFKYEIILVNDSSIDSSKNIALHYKQKNNNIVYIENSKNFGNAYSFYIGLKHATGKYFCVLDADDFYSIRSKLQREIDFLDNDTEQIYTAVGHYTLYYHIDGSVQLPYINEKISEFGYYEFINNSYQYCHTSSMMFRNIYKLANIEHFKSDDFRGDTPRIFWQLFLTRKKVKILKYFGSVYFISKIGIWTKLSKNEQLERNIKFLKSFYQIVPTDTEKKILAQRIADQELNKISDSKETKESLFTKDELLNDIRIKLGHIAFLHKDYMFNNIYSSLYYDTLCQTIGYIQLLELNISEKESKSKCSTKTFAIYISKLIPNGGGIYSELLEYCQYLNTHGKVFVIATEMDNIPLEVNIDFACLKNVILISANYQVDKLQSLLKFHKFIDPDISFFYFGHSNPYIVALPINNNNNFHIFSYDHGLVTGIFNDNCNNFIVKRCLDYSLLHESVAGNILYIPTVVTSLQKVDPFYFEEHQNFTTCTIAARFYKYSINFFDTIILSLKESNRIHIHFGHLDSTELSHIYSMLENNNIPMSKFKHIPWSDDLRNELLLNLIDLFIEPYPIVSYRISLIVMSCGIPIVHVYSVQRLSFVDFIYKDSLSIEHYDELSEKLSILNGSRNILREHSNYSLTYINNFHSNDYFFEIIQSKNNKFDIPTIEILDNHLNNIENEIVSDKQINRLVNRFKDPKVNVAELYWLYTVMKSSDYKFNLPNEIDFFKKWFNDYSFGNNICFCAEGYNVNKYYIQGVSKCEGGYSWTDGMALNLLLNINQDTYKKSDLKNKYLIIDIVSIINQKQQLFIKVNNINIFDKILSTETSVRLHLGNTLKIGFNIISLYLPNAQCSGRDKRLLGLALKSMCIK